MLKPDSGAFGSEELHTDEAHGGSEANPEQLPPVVQLILLEDKHAVADPSQHDECLVDRDAL